MKKLGVGLGIGAGLLAMAAIVMAQTPPAPPGGSPNAPYFGGPPGAGGPPGPGGPGHGPGFRPPMMPPPPSKGAEFRLADGNRRIFVKCADDDSTKACMDAVGPVLNKLIDMK